MLRFLILGPIEILSERRHIEVRGAFQRALLVTLLASTGNFVLTDTLIDELWRGAPPRRVGNALQAHVSRLRRTLENLDPGRQTPQLVTLPSGYRLVLDRDEVDAAIFIQAIQEIRTQHRMDPEGATQRLRAALSLWRGPAFGGAVGGSLCQSSAVRYEQSRFRALELLFDIELESGRHSEIIAELCEVTESEHFNERLCGQLMVAFYRAGRQADALAVYRRMRARLDDQLGIEPSPALQKYEHAILVQDPALDTRVNHVAIRV
jgi:SARP family transcriptional regulator, regulator of embCAB operon